MKYYKNYQNVTQRPEVSKCFWKNGTSRFAQFRITPKLQFIKNAISLKGSKTIKWGIPVYILASIFVILYHRLNIIISQIILLERELKYINNLLTNKHYSNSLLLPTNFNKIKELVIKAYKQALEQVNIEWKFLWFLSL